MNWQHNISAVSARVLKKRYIPIPVKEMAWRALTFVARCGHSNPVSFALRPVFAHKRLRSAVGGTIVLGALVATFLGANTVTSFAGPDTGGAVELSVLPPGDVPFTTTQAVRMPVDRYKVSQGYRAFHPGYDFAAPYGTPVRAISAGTVIVVKKERFAYGQHVIIDHKGEFQSLYAHFSKILVAEGQEVTSDTVVGEIGTSGRSTGPHLHLEVRQSGITINPRTLLDIK